MMLGWSIWSEAEIVRFIEAGNSIDKVPGDFLIVEESSSREVRFIASVASAIPYFYTVLKDGKIVHGTNIFDIVKRSCIPWQWNFKALNDIALLGHTTGADSLHSKVFKVPACGVCIISKSKVTFKPFSFWKEISQLTGGSLEDTLQVAKEIFAEQVGKNDYLLSLTAGYDSRLLLALALDLGHRPKCATMGSKSSTDQKVAIALCEQKGLEHQQVELDSLDYFTNAREIIRMTSGSKTAANWHSYLYGITGNFDAKQIHVVGSNGEFSRSFFFDYSLWPVYKKMPQSIFYLYWTARKLRRRLKFSNGWRFFSNNIKELNYGSNKKMFSALAKTDPLTMLDHFYCTQRVGHFIGNGLRLMGKTGKMRSPFLDARWIRAAAAMPRELKVNNHWHLASIKLLDPSLLEIPFNGFSVNPSDLSMKQAYSISGYNQYEGFANNKKLLNLLVEAKELDVLISEKDRIKAIKNNSFEDINLMITLYFANLEASAVSG